MRRILVIAALFVAPLLAQAQAPSAADPTEHRHLGFYLRLDAGAGYLGSSASNGGISASIAGFGIPFGFSIGGAVTENVIVAGELWGATAISPTYKVNGTSITGGSNSSLTLGGIGVNLTYYFMPSNVYVSLTPSLVTLSQSQAGVSESTNLGFGAKVAVGKEWWVSTHWGLGLAGQFFLGVNSASGAGSPSWTTLGGALAFSATYN